jgi:Tol biopolymer transport system component/N-acetylneuraminic acid mutarotase
MKLMLFVLMMSVTAMADFVYMQETETAKTIQWSGPEGTRTLSESGNEWAIYPDITPDGKEFIFVEGPGNTDLHLTYMNKKTNTSYRFHSPRKGMVLHPKFSKNGRMVFYSAPGESGKNTIYYFNREEEVARQGTNLLDYSLENAKAIDPTEEAYFPRPSSDGNFVVYQRNTNGKKEIVLFDRLENEKTVLAEGMSPALSFDERLVAYTSKISGSWDVYVIDRVTKVVKRITSDAKDEMAPTFLPDNTIVFASNKTGHFRLYNQNWEKITGHDEENLELYSPQFSGQTTYTQTEKASYLGNPRSSFGTVIHNGKLYMCGGHQGAEHTYPPESFSNQFIVYDIAANKWSELPPRPRTAHGYQLAAYGDYIYAFGGFAYSAEHKPRWKSLDVIDRYSIKESKWETIGKLKRPRSSNVAVTIGLKVYLVGGWDATPKFENDADGFFHDTVEIFDLVTEKVSVAPYKIPAPVRRALTGVNYQDKIVLVGGLGQGASHFELIQNVTSIDPVTGEAEELTPLPFATFAPAAEVLGDELYVFGGMFQTGPMNYEYVSHVYALDIKKAQWRHTGRYLKETKGFSQVFPLSDKTLGILGGHHYSEGLDTPVMTFETFSVK